MLRLLAITGILVGLLVGVGFVLADEYEAKVKSIEIDKGKATLTINSQDKVFEMTKDPLVVTDKGKSVPGGLKSLKAGAEVLIFTDKKGDREIITTFKVKALPKKK
jgi:hypothetical protein